MDFNTESRTRSIDPAVGPGTTWRVAAILATITVAGVFGICSWTLMTVADWKTEQPGQPFDLSLPSRSDYQAAAADARRPDLKVVGRNGDLDWLTATSAAPWAPLDAARPIPQLEEPGQHLASVPALQPDAESQDAESRGVTPAPSTSAAEHAKRFVQTRKADHPGTAAPKPHRLAARPTYLEKTIEEGDAGEVSFRYRRRNCTAPNVVDVCFMPAENRRSIVVEHY